MQLALTNKEFAPIEPGAMPYMAGKEGFGGDAAPHWPAHLMFIFSDADPALWGANRNGSPIVGFAAPGQHLTQFVIPVQHWSDATEIQPKAKHGHH